MTAGCSTTIFRKFWSIILKQSFSLSANVTTLLLLLLLLANPAYSVVIFEYQFNFWTNSFLQKRGFICHCNSLFFFLKNAILCAYELVPEAYRQKCMLHINSPSQTQLEFEHKRRVLFVRWCSVRDVTTYEGLCELILRRWFWHSPPSAFKSDQQCKGTA